MYRFLIGGVLPFPRFMKDREMAQFVNLLSDAVANLGPAPAPAGRGKLGATNAWNPRHVGGVGDTGDEETEPLKRLNQMFMLINKKIDT